MHSRVVSVISGLGEVCRKNLSKFIGWRAKRDNMKRIVAFVVLVALGNVSRGAIVDLLDNPGALPAGKPSTVQVGVAASVDGHGQNISVTLTPT